MNPIDNAIVLEEAKRYSDSKGGYTETKKTVLAPPTVAAWGLDWYSFPCLEVTSGMVLDITINNVTHRRIASVLETHGDNIGVAFDGGDFIYLNGTGLVYVDGATENMPDATISIVAVSETIHPIDPKFLPGVCLPVVELSGAETLTTEEQAQLTACAEKRMPVVVKLVQDGMTVYAALVGYMFNGEDREYHIFAGDIGMFTSTKDGVWKAQWA